MPPPVHIRLWDMSSAQHNKTPRGSRNCETANRTSLLLIAPRDTATVNLESRKN